MNKRYNSINSWLQGRFGERVYKVTLDSGLACPNRNRAEGREGCIFCNPESYYPATSPQSCCSGKSIRRQLEEGISYVRFRHGATKFIGYFQSNSNTHAAPERLSEIFDAAMDSPEVVGLAISTRPDCIDEKRTRLLATLASRKLLWVELGLQSAHDETLRIIRRGHTAACFSKAAAELETAGVRVCAHVILGLPGETPEMMKQTAKFLNGNRVWGVKIHNLHVLRGTELCRNYEDGLVSLPDLRQYAEWVADFIELLDPSILVHRVSGHSPRKLTVAPNWSPNKLAIMNAVDAEMERRGSCQGQKSATDLPDLKEARARHVR